MAQIPKFLTIAEAAQALRIPKPSVYAMVRAAILPAHRFSQRRMRIAETDLIQLIEKTRKN